LEAVLKS